MTDKNKKKATRDYIVYHTVNGNNIRYIHSRKPKIIKEASSLDDINVKRQYIVIRSDSTDECLRQFYNNFKVWIKDLKTSKHINKGIDYLSYYSHQQAIIQILRMLSPKYRNIEPSKIGRIEAQWMDKCSNGSLQYCNQGRHMSYGYDFKAFYVKNMSLFKFPINEGKEHKLKELPKTLKCGYYRAKITSNDPNACKIFKFNKDNVYTHIDIRNTRYMCKYVDISVELIIDDEANAYLYEDNDMLDGAKVFKYWFTKISDLRQEYPSNQLIKHISSGLWGRLCRYKKIYITEKEFDKKYAEISDSVYNDNCKYTILESSYIEDKFTLRDNDDVYYSGWARIKSFLTAYSRKRLADTIIKNDLIDNVIRIHTDNITLDREHYFNINDLVTEDKTTGDIDWHSVNSYHNHSTNVSHGRI